MTVYVLIVVTTVTSGYFTTMQEFTTKDSCERAAQFVKTAIGWYGRVECVLK